MLGTFGEIGPLAEVMKNVGWLLLKCLWDCRLYLSSLVVILLFMGSSWS